MCELKNIYEKEFIQTIMLDGRANFINCKEIRYKGVKFRY